MKSQPQLGSGGLSLRWAWALLLLLTASILIAAQVKNSGNHDRQARLEGVSEQIITPWRQNDVAGVEKILADFAQENDIIYLNLTNKSKGYFSEYRRGDPGDYGLANLSQITPHDPQDRTSWDVKDRGVYLGTLDVVWQPSALTHGPNDWLWLALLLLGTTLILAWRGRLSSGWEQPSQAPALEVQSDEIFDSVANGLNLNIRLHEVVDVKNPRHVGYGYVNLEWDNGQASKEIFSFGALSELLSKDSLVLPMFPWILRHLFVQKRTMMLQGASYPMAFEVGGRQFMDDDFRFFLFKICKSNGIPMSSILIEIEEGYLATLAPTVLAETLRQWKTAGVGLIVSNFGSTPLSELILNQFDIQKIKWDASWLNRQWFNSNSRQRVMSLQALAKRLQVATVVNDEFQSLNHRVLNDLDFDFLQKQGNSRVFKLNHTANNHSPAWQNQAVPSQMGVLG